MPIFGLNLQWPEVSPGWIGIAMIFVIVGVLGVVGFQMYQGYPLTCPGQFLPPEKCKTTPSETVDLTGAVIAFDLNENRVRNGTGAQYNTESDGCPPGWIPFTLSHGRMIVGAGDPEEAPRGLGLDENKVALTNRLVRDTGGTEKHKLISKELPRHEHSIIGRKADMSDAELLGWGQGMSLNSESADGLRIVVRNREPYESNKGELVASKFDTSDSGVQLHHNMPPYLALYYCKKSEKTSKSQR